MQFLPVECVFDTPQRVKVGLATVGGLNVLVASAVPIAVVFLAVAAFVLVALVVFVALFLVAVAVYAAVSVVHLVVAAAVLSAAANRVLAVATEVEILVQVIGMAEFVKVLDDLIK